MFKIIETVTFSFNNNFRVHRVKTSSGKHWLFVRKEILLHFDDVNFKKFKRDKNMPIIVLPLRIYRFTTDKDHEDYQKIKHLM